MDEYQFNIKASTDTNINYTYHRVTVLGFSFLVSQGIFFFNGIAFEKYTLTGLFIR